MRDSLKIGLSGIGLALLIGVFTTLGFAFVTSHTSSEPKTVVINQEPLGSPNTIADRNFIALGTSTSSPLTLTTGYATSSVLKMLGLSNIVIAGQYTPKTYGSTLYIIIERSIDNGQTYWPYDTVTPAATQISVYNQGLVTTSSFAVPIVIPSAGVSASGTAMDFSLDTSLAGDYMRISVKEVTTSTAGTAYIQVLSTNH